MAKLLGRGEWTLEDHRAIWGEQRVQKTPTFSDE